MQIGFCKFCDVYGSLAQSHSIPNAYFKKIKKADSGKIIIINDGADLAKKTINSGADHLLCEGCEKFFNQKFDSFLISTFAQIRSIPAKKHLLVKHELDTKRLCLSISSVLWRASLAKNELYNAFILPGSLAGELKNCLKSELGLNQTTSITINSLYDDTPEADGRFSDAAIENLVLSPRLLKIKTGFGIRSKHGFGAIVIFGGMSISFTWPALSKSAARNKNYLLDSSKYVHVKSADIFEVPFVLEFFSRAVAKEQNSGKRIPHYSASSS